MVNNKLLYAIKGQKKSHSLYRVINHHQSKEFLSQLHLFYLADISQINKHT